MDYSLDFKEAVLKKVFADNDKGVTEIAREVGMPSSTIFTWINRMKKKNISANHKKTNTVTGVSAKSRSAKPFSKREKFDLAVKYFSLSDDLKGEFLRKHGLYSAELESWKEEFTLTTTGSKQKSRAKDLKKIKQLERDLRRKDKALAEASALLILKKKADLLWGTDED